jgi:PIN domain nuclease of toxin-antitoxin system
LKLLLDTHVLLWWLEGSVRLSRQARRTIAGSEEVWVSAASAWELGIKSALGKLRTPDDLEFQVKASRFRELPVTLAHAVAAGKLPRHHNDPLDRMLVAQAALESLTLLTVDRQLQAYGIRVILA